MTFIVLLSWGRVDAPDFRGTRTHLHTGHRWLGDLPGDDLLVGPDKIHVLDDALRLWIEKNPQWLDDVRLLRPNGPLAISYCTKRRGGKPPTPWRYDAVWVSSHPSRIWSAQSARDENANTDRIIDQLGAGVASGQVCPVVSCGQRDERITYCATRDTQVSEYLRKAPGYVGVEE